MVDNVRTGTQALAFNVLGAYGYPEGGERPRLWALRAYHRATTTEWVDFLAQLDTSARPRLVITDGAPGIAHAVRQVGPSFSVSCGSTSTAQTSNASTTRSFATTWRATAAGRPGNATATTRHYRPASPCAAPSGADGRKALRRTIGTGKLREAHVGPPVTRPCGRRCRS